MTRPTCFRPRLSLALTALATVAAVLAPGATSVAQDEPRVLRVGVHAFEGNFNPFTPPTALPYTHDLYNLVYDTLFWSQARLEPEPWLATGAEPSEDNSSWTVRLREGVTWHDGEPFTADDVAFSFQYFKDIAGPGRYGHHVYGFPVLAGTEVIDDTTVRIDFEEPAPAFELIPGGDLPILPEHIWSGIDDPSADTTTLPVGTGPFRMVELEPDRSNLLVANDEYFKGAPLVDEIQLNLVQDPSAAFGGLQSGELDFVTRTLPAQLVPQFEADDDLGVIEGTRFQSLSLMFNTKRPPFDDAAVRKALSEGIDSEAVVAAVFQGAARPGNDSWTHPDSPWAHPDGGHDFDPDAARDGLDEAGFAAGPDGMRTGPDGTPLQLTILADSFSPPQVRSAQVVAEQLGQLGVNVTVEPIDPAALSARRRPPGPGQAPDYDAYTTFLESHAHADPDHLYFFFHTPGPKVIGGIFTGFSDPEFDAATERALSQGLDERRDSLEEAQEIFAEAAPAVMLAYPDGRWGYREAAYDLWVADPGHGVFTKRSFLEEYAGTDQDEAADEAAAEAGLDDVAAGGDGGDGAGALALGAAAVVAVAAIAAYGVTRRRRSADTIEE
ncbi:MAG TPA: ABC transporter substrate-binding protein [Acidimicrobiales bacterium]|nr:ABC transporter substrate-binding protein [Acidimicrobiales bacterium]